MKELPIQNSPSRVGEQRYSGSSKSEKARRPFPKSDEEQKGVPLPDSLPSPMRLHAEHSSTAQPIESSAALDDLLATLTQAVPIKVSYMKTNGILELQCSIDIPNLQQLDIQIRHYDTAPDSFHIEIATTPENLALLESSLAQLQANLQHALEKHVCHIGPIILRPSSHSFSKKTPTSSEKRKKVVESSSFVYSPESNR